MIVTCDGPEATLSLGEAIGLFACGGLLVLLQGPLGAGKTVLAKGIAKGLGVPEWRYVTSPTFTIHNTYEGRLRLHHLDLYRLVGSGELEDLGLEEVLYGSEVCVIEWPDLFFRDLPSDRLELRLEWQESQESRRRIEIRATGARSGQVGDRLRQRIGGHLEGGER